MATVRDRAREESRLSNVLWGLLALVLVGGPVFTTLSRTDGYSASVQVFPTRLKPFPAIRSPERLRDLVATDAVTSAAIFEAGHGVTSLDVTIRRASHPPGTLMLTATAATPAQAAAVANAVADQLGNTTLLSIRKEATRRVRAIQAKLRQSGLSAAEIEDLNRRRSLYEQLLANPLGALLFGERPAAPPVRGWADRLIHGLPGSLPPKPSPIWAGAAGLIVLSVLWLGWLLRPRRP
jgi:hypothetical protein